MPDLTRLGAAQRSAMAEHLLALNAEDRANRFLGAVGDNHIQSYIRSIGFARDVLIGSFRSNRLVALAHAGVTLEGGELVGEVGISVDRSLRRSGMGKQLLKAVVDMARQRGVQRVEVMFNSDNRAMAALTRSLGGRISFDRSESRASLPVPGAADQPRIPLLSTRSAAGHEVVQARHPQERGRALLVHGAGGDSYPWLARLVPALWAAGYSIHAPTLPGHGRDADPSASSLTALQDCVTEAAEAFAPTLMVGHSMGGYLVQRHLEQHDVQRSALLASLPPHLPRDDRLERALGKLHCPLARACAETALVDAPDLQPLNLRALAMTPMQVIGGQADAVVSRAWVCDTASRYGVEPVFVSGGHEMLTGKAGEEVARLLTV